MSAFTLIELLVVVVLLGLAAALVGPRLGGITEQARLQAATAELERAWSVARHQAALRHAPVALILEPRGTRYRIARISESDAPGAWLAIGDVRIVDFRRSASQSPDNWSIRVSPTGAVLPWAVQLEAGRARRIIWCRGGSQSLHHRDGSDLSGWDPATGEVRR